MTSTNAGASPRTAWTALGMSTLAFTVCFAVWMINGVLATHLVDTGTFSWDRARLGWLIGIPVLTGSVLRLPVGILTDRLGGRLVFTVLMLASAIPLWLVSYAQTYAAFAWASLGFGLAGASFAVGAAYSASFFPPARKGTALGIFGAGNAGAALTTLFAPALLRGFTDGGASPEGWRTLPRVYAVLLAATAVAFWLSTTTRRGSGAWSLGQRLAPLRQMRVWRFGLYYFLLFGGFVTLAQWLVPYYVSVYSMSVASAGATAALFSLPSGATRALGGWLSDRVGARRTMYWVLSACALGFLLLSVPRMEIRSPGEGVMAVEAGTVRESSSTRVVVGDRVYPLRPRPGSVRTLETPDGGALVLPKTTTWQDPIVRPGDAVAKRQLLARGTTQVYFQANVGVFTAILFAVGVAMGLGMAAVYKHVPEYFPENVGVVGGIVGVLGGLGGFAGPILFGSLLEATGLWTSCWLVLLVLSLACLAWMHRVVRRMIRERVPSIAECIEDPAPRPPTRPATPRPSS